MTMAAGFVASDGVLLCADTLFTDGYTKEERDKIFVWTGKYSAVCFAISGNANIARATVDACKAKLTIDRQSHLSKLDILECLNKTLTKAFLGKVDTRPTEHEREAADFQLLIALETSTEGASLLAAVRPDLVQIDTFECHGNGRQLGRYIIEGAYDRSQSVGEMAILATCALSATKQIVDGVGGKSQFVMFRDGRLSGIVPYDVNRAEPLVREYQRRSSVLLKDISRQDLPDERVEDELARFVAHARELRREWLADATPWRELVESLSAIHQQVTPSLPRSTRGQKRQPPSPA